MKAWFCTICGRENEATGAFCVGCGAPRPEGFAVGGEKKSKKTLLLIGGVLLGLALIGLGLWLLLGRGQGEGAKGLWRTTYMRYTSSFSDDPIVTEWYYHYEKETGRVEVYTNGQYSGYQLLRLDKRGKVVREENYNAEGELLGFSEREYDRYGNTILQKLYDADGSLVRRVESSFDAYRVAEESSTISYADGQESTRSELHFSDREHGTQEMYSEGELTRSYSCIRSYDGNKLLNQQNWEDGNRISTLRYVLDEDYNQLLFENVSGNGKVLQTYEYGYERIG